MADANDPKPADDPNPNDPAGGAKQPTAEDIARLQTALQSARGEARTAQAELTKLTERLAALEAKGEGKGNKSNEADLEEARRKAADAESRATAAEKRARDTELDHEITSAILKHEGYPDRLKPILRDWVKKDEKGRTVIENPTTGARMLKPGASTEEMDLDTFVGKALAENPEYDWAFRPRGPGGSGATGSARNPGNPRPASVTSDQLRTGKGFKLEDLAAGKLKREG